MGRIIRVGRIGLFRTSEVCPDCSLDGWRDRWGVPLPCDFRCDPALNALFGVQRLEINDDPCGKSERHDEGDLSARLEKAFSKTQRCGSEALLNHKEGRA